MTDLMDEMEKTVRRATSARATHWHVRCAGEELSEEEKIAFLEWLRDSRKNLQEYLAAAQFDALLSRAHRAPAAISRSESARSAGITAENVVELDFANQNAVRSESKRSRWFSWGIVSAAAGSAVAAGAALLWGLVSLSHVMPSSVEVPHGHQQTVALNDGSVMHLNSSSRVKIRYTDTERLIELEHGQVLFKVAREPARPFHVRTAMTDIMAVGTEFDVYRPAGTDRTRVTVIEGQVDVIDPRVTSAIASESKAIQERIRSIRLDAGEQVQLGSTMAAPKPAPADMQRATAWVRREVVFSGQTLAEVVDEFNRYLSVPLRIEDPTLRQKRISGAFSAYDAEAFLDFLRQLDGVVIEKGRREIRVRMRAPETLPPSTVAQKPRTRAVERSLKQ